MLIGNRVIVGQRVELGPVKYRLIELTHAKITGYSDFHLAMLGQVIIGDGTDQFVRELHCSRTLVFIRRSPVYGSRLGQRVRDIVSAGNPVRETETPLSQVFTRNGDSFGSGCNRWPELQARLAFERGVQYLRKQPEPKAYEEQLTYLEKLLARANAQVLENMEPAENEQNELTQGLKTDDEETWKKRVIYD